MNQKTQFFRAAVLAWGIAFLATAGNAQPAFPSKPITMVIPFAPGGTSDLVARIMAEKVTATLGQPVIVDNRSGADGILGANTVAKATPDGHTLLQISTTHVILPSLRKDIPYDWKKDLVPVFGQMGVPQLLIVNANSKIQDMKDFAALAKSRPGGLNYGSAGTGTLGQLTSQLIYLGIGAPANHIPYRGLSLAMQAVMGDQVDTAALNFPETLSLVKSGKLRALAITSERRAPELPDVPTLKELGFSEPIATSWTAILAPAGTPERTIKILHDAYAKAVAEPEVAQRLRQMGVEQQTLSPADLQRFMNAEEARWRNVIAKQGVRRE